MPATYLLVSLFGRAGATFPACMIMGFLLYLHGSRVTGSQGFLHPYARIYACRSSCMFLTPIMKVVTVTFQFMVSTDRTGRKQPMRNRNSLPIGPTKRMTFGVSEQMPIRVLRPIRVPHNPTAEPQRTGVSFDMHYELEIGITTRGVMRRYYADGWHRDYGPGEVWFHGMWEPHGWEGRNPSCQVVILLIWPPLLANFRFPEAPDVPWMAPFHPSPINRPNIRPSNRPAFVRLARALADTDEREPSAAAFLHRRWLLQELLLLACDDLPRAHVDAATFPAHFDNIAPCLEQAFSSRRVIATAAAARACGFSPDRFMRLFPKLMGMPFRQFALRCRLGQAARELLTNETPVKAVAANWGFANESHLHRLFVQHYRCTPADYRAAKARPEESRPGPPARHGCAVGRPVRARRASTIERRPRQCKAGAPARGSCHYP